MSQKILLFLMPTLMFLKIKAIGVLYVPELISLFLFLQFFPRIVFFYSNQLKIFIILALLYLFSQIFSDIYRQTPPQDFMRGWSNIVFFIVHTSTLFVLLDNDKKNFFIFGLGYVLGVLLSLIFTPNMYFQSGAIWKFGYLTPITFLVALITTRINFQNEFIKIFIFLSLSLFNFYFGFRSLGGVCLFISLFMTIIKFDFIRKFLDNKQPIQLKIISFIIFFLFLSYFVNYSYSFLAVNEYLGLEELQRYQSQVGNFGILIGGRQEVLTSIYAVMNSPFIGYGSWAINPFSENLLSGLLLDFGYYKAQAFNYFDDRIPTHSHLLGAWVSSGIFGIFIWIWFLYNIIKAIILNSIIKDNWNAFFLFICVFMIWKIFFSSFSGEARFFDAFYLCLILFINDKLIKNAK